MHYAGIELHPTDSIPDLLAAFSGHTVRHYKSKTEFAEWCKNIGKKLSREQTDKREKGPARTL